MAPAVWLRRRCCPHLYALVRDPEAGKPRRIFTLIVGGDSPVLGTFDACTLDQPQSGELGRLRCNDGATIVRISITRAGNAVIAHTDMGKALARIPIPAAQHVASLKIRQ